MSFIFTWILDRFGFTPKASIEFPIAKPVVKKPAKKIVRKTVRKKV
jgi:hypothetical protein